jgi:lysophospholipase L1-like esterase
MLKTTTFSFAAGGMILVALVGLLAALSGEAAVGQTAATASVPPTDKNLRYIGRWDRSDPTNSHGDWIGSYVRVDFTGTSVAVNLGGNHGLDVVIDGEPTRAVVGGPGIVALNPAPLSPGVHTLLVGVKGGGGWDFKGLALDAGAKTKAPIKRPIIESIGDSITSGSPGPIEAAGNYTWLTAEALGCDHTQISWPGRALTTGYGCQDDKRGLDKQYFQTKCFYDSGPDTPWDFSTYTPKIVVINLGQNDGCGGESNETFLASYTGFLKSIRAKLPKAQIVALRPFGGGYASAVQQAVAAVNAGGDTAVHYVDTTGWLDNPADFVDGVHPNDQGDHKLMLRLVPIYKPLLSKKG